MHTCISHHHVLHFLHLFRIRFRAALANNDWIVDYNDIVIISDEKGALSSVALRSMTSAASRDNQKDK